MASIDELKARTAEAMRLYDRLRTRQALATKAGLVSEYSGVVSRFARVRDALQKLTDTGSLTDAVRVLWNGEVGALGVAPIIAWAGASVAIAGALAAISAWLTDAYKLDARLTAYERALAAGQTPEQAAKATATASGDYAPSSGPGLSFDVSGLAVPAGIVALVVFGPRLVDAWKSRKG